MSVRIPFTGPEYAASLRDDRAVYINSERVADITAHPAFANSIRSIASLYDALHAPGAGDTLTCPTDTGNGGFTHRFFRVPRSAADLAASRAAIATWARMTYGWMGRTPDYKASLTTTFGANPDFYGPYAANARAWYAFAQERVPFINHTVVNPPVDRHKPNHDVKDIYVHVERETDAGIIVSGAKVVATSAAITHYTFVGQTPKTASDDPDMAVSFIAAVNSPGIRIFCRASFELAAARHGSPFDYPLSSRFDENDAILTFDHVLIPWENVLIHRDPRRVKSFFFGTGFFSNFLFHGCIRLGVKLEFIAGLLAKALHTTGGDEFRGNQAMLGEVISLRNLIDSLADAMTHHPDPWPGNPSACSPQRKAAMAYCVAGPDIWPRVRDIVNKTIASALVYLPSSAADLLSPDIAPHLAKYVRGSHGIDAVQRIKTMKLLWDAVGSEFAGRHELYERNYAGGHEDIRLTAVVEAEKSGKLAEYAALVDRCMADYDAAGWVSPVYAPNHANPAAHAA